MSTIDDSAAPARVLRKDAARNRELLLAAAREVFAERGLDASLDDVARRAGVGVGTAYRHFANKYELAGAIFQQEVAAIAALAQAGLAADDPWDGLVLFLEEMLEAQTVNRGLREVLMGVHDDDLEDEVHDLLSGPIVSLMVRAQESGAVRADADATDLGMMIIMLCTVADVAAEADPQLWRRYLPILLAGFRPDGPALPVPALSEDVMRKAMSSHKQRMARVTAQR
jgi:AcrR family transcriptional regulator